MGSLNELRDPIKSTHVLYMNMYVKLKTGKRRTIRQNKKGPQSRFLSTSPLIIKRSGCGKHTNCLSRESSKDIYLPKELSLSLPVSPEVFHRTHLSFTPGVIDPFGSTGSRREYSSRVPCLFPTNREEVQVDPSWCEGGV